jgi:MYXO-CTERM domain-containing protein
VIAGTGDGKCSKKRGGLGMFQFDGGTHSDTLRRDGNEILELEGNISHAVDFTGKLVDLGQRSVSSTEGGIEWMNDVRLVKGDAKLEAWASTMACRYNGCCKNTKRCRARRAKYRDNALHYYDKYGADFWDDVGAPLKPSCPVVPRDGRIIDEEDECFVAEGAAKYWRAVESGYNAGSLWTMTTSSSKGSNKATWKLFVAEPGRYRIDVHMDGGLHGKSAQAKYVVKHAEGTTEVAFNQGTAPIGFSSLGEFNLSPSRRQQIQLADNTGEPSSAQVELLFDAIQLVRVGDFDDTQVGLVIQTTDEDLAGADGEGEVVSGCAAGGSGTSGGGLSILALALVGVVRRRRARAA